MILNCNNWYMCVACMHTLHGIKTSNLIFSLIKNCVSNIMACGLHSCSDKLIIPVAASLACKRCVSLHAEIFFWSPFLTISQLKRKLKLSASQNYVNMNYGEIEEQNLIFLKKWYFQSVYTGPKPKGKIKDLQKIYINFKKSELQARSKSSAKKFVILNLHSYTDQSIWFDHLQVSILPLAKTCFLHVDAQTKARSMTFAFTMVPRNGWCCPF